MFNTRYHSLDNSKNSASEYMQTAVPSPLNILHLRLRGKGFYDRDQGLQASLIPKFITPMKNLHALISLLQNG